MDLLYVHHGGMLHSAALGCAGANRAQTLHLPASHSVVAAAAGLRSGLHAGVSSHRQMCACRAYRALAQAQQQQAQQQLAAQALAHPAAVLSRVLCRAAAVKVVASRYVQQAALLHGWLAGTGAGCYLCTLVFASSCTAVVPPARNRRAVLEVGLLYCCGLPAACVATSPLPAGCRFKRISL